MACFPPPPIHPYRTSQSPSDDGRFCIVNYMCHGLLSPGDRDEMTNPRDKREGEHTYAHFPEKLRRTGENMTFDEASLKTTWIYSSRRSEWWLIPPTCCVLRRPCMSQSQSPAVWAWAEMYAVISRFLPPLYPVWPHCQVLAPVDALSFDPTQMPPAFLRTHLKSLCRTLVAAGIGAITRTETEFRKNYGFPDHVTEIHVCPARIGTFLTDWDVLCGGVGCLIWLGWRRKGRVRWHVTRDRRTLPLWEMSMQEDYYQHRALL